MAPISSESFNELKNSSNSGPSKYYRFTKYYILTADKDLQNNQDLKILQIYREYKNLQNYKKYIEYKNVKKSKIFLKNTKILKEYRNLQKRIKTIKP
jgi:hypothetical protein